MSSDTGVKGPIEMPDFERIGVDIPVSGHDISLPATPAELPQLVVLAESSVERMGVAIGKAIAAELVPTIQRAVQDAMKVGPRLPGEYELQDVDFDSCLPLIEVVQFSGNLARLTRWLRMENDTQQRAGVVTALETAIAEVNRGKRSG